MSLAGLRATVWKNKPVLLKLSDDSESGFLNVCKLRTNNKGTTWYAKFVPEGEKRQRALPGSCSKDPMESAAELAYYLAGHRDPLGSKEIRKPRRDREVLKSLRCAMPRASPACPLSLFMCVLRRKLNWIALKRRE